MCMCFSSISTRLCVNYSLSYGIAYFVVVTVRNQININVHAICLVFPRMHTKNCTLFEFDSGRYSKVVETQYLCHYRCQGEHFTSQQKIVTAYIAVKALFMAHIGRWMMAFTFLTTEKKEIFQGYLVLSCIS